MSDEQIRKGLVAAWEDQIVAGFHDESSQQRMHTEILADAMIDVWKDYMSVGADPEAVAGMVLKLVGGMITTLGYCHARGVL